MKYKGFEPTAAAGFRLFAIMLMLPVLAMAAVWWVFTGNVTVLIRATWFTSGSIGFAILYSILMNWRYNHDRRNRGNPTPRGTTTSTDDAVGDPPRRPVVRDFGHKSWPRMPRPSDRETSN